MSEDRLFVDYLDIFAQIVKSLLRRLQHEVDLEFFRLLARRQGSPTADQQGERDRKPLTHCPSLQADRRPYLAFSYPTRTNCLGQRESGSAWFT